MDELLTKILDTELLNEDTKQEVAKAFQKVLGEAKVEIEKKMRAEYSERYEHDKAKIAEAVEQYVEQRMDSHITELRSQLKGLEKQRIQYVKMTEALKTQSSDYIKKRLAIWEAAADVALKKEMHELHEEQKVNRGAVLKVLAEVRTRGEADRNAFKKKAALVLEHINTVKFEREMADMKEDIRIAKENDFGRELYETYMATARRQFFNSSKEHRGLLQRLAVAESTNKKSLAEMQAKLDEAVQSKNKMAKSARQLQESVVRQQKTAKLLAAVPAGAARQQMKSLLEATAVADLDKTFTKYSSKILNETRRVQPVTARPVPQNEVTLHTGNNNTMLTESAEDDDDLLTLRRHSGVENERYAAQRRAGMRK